MSRRLSRGLSGPGINPAARGRMMARRIASLLLALFALGALLSAACEERDGADNGVRVVTSSEVLADLVRNAAGDRAQVTALIPSGADPHTYEPSPAQVVDVTEADLMLLNGLGFEETLRDIIENNVSAGVPIIEMSEGLRTLDGGDEDGLGNPHLWLNVRHAMHYVEVARDGLIQVDPEGDEEYRASAEEYLAELSALDEEVAQSISSISPARRKIVMHHNAFPYFAERYGMEVGGFVVESPGREPSAAEVAELIEDIRSLDISALFREPQFRSRILEQAASDAGIEICTLYTGALGDGIDSYVELMRHNAEELVRCLGE
jgi:manganese/iron transport system substrate-binding protein